MSPDCEPSRFRFTVRLSHLVWLVGHGLFPSSQALSSPSRPHTSARQTSARQLRAGFKKNRSHDFFTNRADGLWWLWYTIYRAVPFFWEMRNYLDWSCAATTLKFPYWLTVEDIYHEVYLRKVDLLDTASTNAKAGTPYPRLWKILCGGLVFLLLLFVLFFPLLIYSTFNPSLQSNSITSISETLAFEGTSPFFSAQISSAGTNEWGGLQSLERRDLKVLANTRPILKNYEITSKYKTAQLVTSPLYSSSVWSMSPPSRAELTTALSEGKGGNIVHTTTVTRALGGMRGPTLSRCSAAILWSPVSKRVSFKC